MTDPEPDPASAVIGLYRRHAAAWTGARGTALREKAWLDRLLGLLPANADVLDIGCGSGVPIARYVGNHGHSVTGVDGSPEMIALFERNLPGQATIVADMRSLHLGRRFSGLIAWDSVFHLAMPDQRGMIPIFRDYAAPGAPLMFTSGPEAGEAIGTLEGEPLFHASLDPAEYSDLLDRCGFDVLDHVPEDPICDRTVWLARRRR